MIQVQCSDDETVLGNLRWMSTITDISDIHDINTAQQLTRGRVIHRSNGKHQSLIVSNCTVKLSQTTLTLKTEPTTNTTTCLHQILADEIMKPTPSGAATGIYSREWPLQLVMSMCSKCNNLMNEDWMNLGHTVQCMELQSYNNVMYTEHMYTKTSDTELPVTFPGGNLTVFYMYDTCKMSVSYWYRMPDCLYCGQPCICRRNFSKSLCHHVNATAESVPDCQCYILWDDCTVCFSWYQRWGVSVIIIIIKR